MPVRILISSTYMYVYFNSEGWAQGPHSCVWYLPWSWLIKWGKLCMLRSTLTEADQTWLNECTEVQNPKCHHVHIICTRAIQGKMADRMYGFQRRECWISETELFQRKPHKSFDLGCLLSTWQYLQDEHTHRQSNYSNPTAYTRWGLIMWTYLMPTRHSHLSIFGHNIFL